MNSTLHSPAPRLSPRQALVVSTTSVGFVVSQLDVTIVNVALDRLGHDLHASLASLQWTVDAYALAFAALMLSAGALGSARWPPATSRPADGVGHPYGGQPGRSPRTEYG